MRRNTTDPGGGGVQTAADFVVRFCKGVSSSLSTGSQVQWTVTGAGDLDNDPDSDAVESDDNGERSEDALVFGALGIIGRELPPLNNEHLEVMCVRTGDQLVPFAARDVRLKMGGSGPTEGVIALVGYGGGFHSLTPVADGSDPAGSGTIHVIYCPYDFDSDGVAQKAHTLILDPTPDNESIQLIHGEGMALTMFDGGKKELLLKNASGNATIRLDDDGITMTAVRIVLSGGVIVGDPSTAVPLLAGSASPPSTKFYVSP